MRRDKETERDKGVDPKMATAQLLAFSTLPCQNMQSALKHIQSSKAMATFLETHADMVNNKDQHGDALVHFAARAHAVDVLQVLHDHGADLGAVNEHGIVHSHYTYLQ